MEDFMKNLADSAKEAANTAGEKLNELKDAAAEKVGEWSDKAEALAAEAKAEAAEKLAEAQAAREKIAAHEGGALGFLSDKGKELLGDVQEVVSDAVEDGKSFWEKAKDFASDKVADAKEALSGKDDTEKTA